MTACVQSIANFKIGDMWQELKQSRISEEVNSRLDVSELVEQLRSTSLDLSSSGAGPIDLERSLEAQTEYALKAFHEDLMSTCAVGCIMTGAISKSGAAELARSALHQ
jgi:hypothetical protein